MLLSHSSTPHIKTMLLTAQKLQETVKIKINKLIVFIYQKKTIRKVNFYILFQFFFFFQKKSYKKNMEMISLISINVKKKDSDPINCTMNPRQTIYELKEQIYKETEIHPTRQNLVYRGNVLVDDFSVGFYDIKDTDTIFLSTIKDSISTTCASLIYYLNDLFRASMTANKTQRASINKTIQKIIKDPILTASARLNPQARQAIDTAKRVIMHKDSKLLSYYNQLVLKKDDFSLLAVESLPDGLRAICTAYQEDDDACEFEEERQSVSKATKTCYIPCISENPLPTPWKSQSSTFRNAAELTIGGPCIKMIKRSQSKNEY